MGLCYLGFDGGCVRVTGGLSAWALVTPNLDTKVEPVDDAKVAVLVK